MRKALVALALALSAATAVGAQDWGFINPLMARSLDIRPGEPPATLFVDNADPNVAQLGLAIAYTPNRFGGNSIGISVGLFARASDGWRFAGAVNNLFGTDPRDPAFLGDRIEITTTTHGPNEPRCCPTQATRWSVDVASRLVTVLR